VCGRLENREWTDKQGNKRIVAEIIAEEISFAGSKESDGGQSRTPVPTDPYVPSAYTSNNQNFEEIPSDEGLPF
jgi:single-strand DNA-binding protein